MYCDGCLPSLRLHGTRQCHRMVCSVCLECPVCCCSSGSGSGAFRSSLLQGIGGSFVAPKSAEDSWEGGGSDMGSVTDDDDISEHDTVVLKQEVPVPGKHMRHKSLLELKNEVEEMNGPAPVRVLLGQWRARVRGHVVVASGRLP